MTNDINNIYVQAADFMKQWYTLYVGYIISVVSINYKVIAIWRQLIYLRTTEI